nr:hypothetical protein [Cellulosimicrobium composti]
MAQVEGPLVRLDRPRDAHGVVLGRGAHVDRLAVHGPPEPPRVDDGDEALLDLGVAVGALGVRLVELLVDARDERGGVVVRFGLVEHAAHADVPVGHGEEGRDDPRVVDVEGGLPQGPRVRLGCHADTPPRVRVAHPSGGGARRERYPTGGGRTRRDALWRRRRSKSRRAFRDFCLLSTQLSHTC